MCAMRIHNAAHTHRHTHTQRIKKKNNGGCDCKTFWLAVYVETDSGFYSGARHTIYIKKFVMATTCIYHLTLKW